MNFSQPQPANGIRVYEHRYGVVLARVGASFAVDCTDGVQRRFEVRPRSRYQSAPIVWRCLDCGKTAKTEKDLRAAHPDHAALVRLQKKHTIAMFSEEPCAVPDPGPMGGKIDPAGAIVGLLASDESI